MWTSKRRRSRRKKIPSDPLLGRSVTYIQKAGLPVLEDDVDQEVAHQLLGDAVLAERCVAHLQALQVIFLMAKHNYNKGMKCQYVQCVKLTLFHILIPIKE